MKKAGVRALEAFMLSLSSELNSVADDLASKAHSCNCTGDELLEIISNAVDALRNDTLPRFDERLERLCRVHMKYAHIA